MPILKRACEEAILPINDFVYVLISLALFPTAIFMEQEVTSVCTKSVVQPCVRDASDKGFHVTEGNLSLKSVVDA